MKQNRKTPQQFFFDTILALAILLSLVGVQPAMAQSVATWYVSTTGNDSNDCATTTTPCATINGAIGKAAAGDTILVATGTYTGVDENVVRINKSINISGGWDESFATQTNLSTIDGQSIRSVISIAGETIVNLDHLKVENGFSIFPGAGIYNAGNLTINNSVITKNTSETSGGGIYDAVMLVINNSTISNNRSGRNDVHGGGGGAGISSYDLTLNNSTVNNNRLYGGVHGSGIFVFTNFTLNNSTISNNTGGGGEGIYGWRSNGNINNTTIFGNETHGLASDSGKINIRNTIIVGNGSATGDCRIYAGNVISQGYNLIGKSDNCRLTSATGDLLGSIAKPISARLAPLADNGGPTFTHALLSGSLALGKGNPASPGSDGNACLSTDQRGITRPFGDICDIGAYEATTNFVKSIRNASSSPTSAKNLDYIVIFSDSVTGVDATDFSLTTTLANANVVGVNGADNTYTVSVDLGDGNQNGNLRLDLIDNDSILDSTGQPLGGPGNVNGDFTFGATYKVIEIPTPIKPNGKIYGATITYEWNVVPKATAYRYQVLDSNNKIIQTKLVSTGVCNEIRCIYPSPQVTTSGIYRWRIQAKVGGIWNPYSFDKFFTYIGPDPGFWYGDIQFYVNTDKTQIQRFVLAIQIPACNISRYWITKPVTEINNGRFSFTGSFYANGNFPAIKQATGQLGLKSYYIPGCGYLTGGPFTWYAKWLNSSQPTLDIPDGQSFTITGLPEQGILNAFPFDVFVP